MNGTHWTGHAFGVALDSEFPLPGLVPGVEPPDARLLRLRLRAAEELAATWPEQGTQVIAHTLDEKGERATWIESHPGEGYLFEAPGIARFRLSPDGRDLHCSPPGAEPELWTLYLAGQALPFVSVLQGLEVLHASAVAVNGAAFALAGESGAGKSTLALNLHLAGAEFLTDDVLAVEMSERGPVAHPGLAWAKLRSAARDRVPAALLAAKGQAISANDEEARYELERPGGPFPLAGVYLLEPADVDGLVLLPGRPDARDLLASSFNLVVETPERLLHHLEICAAIAAGRVTRALVPDRPGRDVADALLGDMRARSGGYDFRTQGQAGTGSAW